MTAKTFRVEKDSLGEMQVPAGAFYGAQTQRAVENFPISGLKPWRAFIWSIALVKRSAALVNFELGLFNAREADGKKFSAKQLAEAIAQAGEEVMQGKWDEQFVVEPFQAGAGTSHNMNANEVMANRATQILGGELGKYYVHPNDHVNMAQSTNDTIPTAIRLGALWRLDELLGALQNLQTALEAKAKEFDHIVKSGRTHLQDAVPVRLGQEFSAYAKAVERDVERIKRSAEGLRRLGIGGTAVGSGLNAHPEYHKRMVKKISELSGLQLTESDNLFESMQSMADAADFSASLRTLALTLIRIANDFRLLASGPSTGLDEIRLPAVQPGSSIMPGKVNPVMAEMLDQAMFHVVGCDTTVALAAQAGQLELNVMMPILGHNLFEMMQVIIGSVNAFTERAVKGLTANQEKAEGWLAKNTIVVTALNPVIGYSQGAALVKEALALNASIKELALEKANSGKLTHRDEERPVTADEIESALSDLRKLTDGGISGVAGGG
ncbi:MAG: aspartate ammonia-lyase [Anaerolineales bacterium]|nr:aspartate ammonia-lyase [Anaerolineales bacterium]MCZ2121970.1 aspartate ammonia-lyase [Anaerolineales bacterium]